MLERVDCSRVMVLDGRRHFVLKTSDEHMENEESKYQQTSGVGISPTYTIQLEIRGAWLFNDLKVQTLY